MGEDERAYRERIAAIGRAWQEQRRLERTGRPEGRPITYYYQGLAIRLLPGQRATIPLAHGGTLTLCGEATE